MRNATTCGRNAGELELAQGLVVLSHLALALQNVDLYRSLVVGCGGVDFRLAGRNGGVAVDHLGHYAAHGFNAKGKRGNVKKEDALNVASKNTALNSCAHCNNLIGVNRHVGLLTRHVLHQFLNGRHTGGTANEDYLVNIARGKASVAQSLLNRLLAAVEQIFGDALELGTGKGIVQVKRASCASRNEGQVDVGLSGGGKLHLCLFSCFLQALQGHLVGAKIDAVFSLELVGHPVDYALIPVVAAQVIVASGRANFEYAVAQLKNGNVERTAAKVEYQNLFVLVGFVETVSKSRCRRLVDDTHNLKTSDLACILGCLTLSVVEISRNGDNSLGDRLAYTLFCIGLNLLQNHCGNLFRHVVLAINVHNSTATIAVLYRVSNSLLLFAGLSKGATDETLYRCDGVFGIGNSLVLCGLAYRALAIFAKANNGRRSTVAFCINQNFRLGALHHCHCRIGGAQVDANDLCHLAMSFQLRPPAVAELCDAANLFLPKLEPRDIRFAFAGFQTCLRCLAASWAFTDTSKAHSRRPFRQLE